MIQLTPSQNCSAGPVNCSN